MLRVLGHSQAIREIDHVFDAGARARAHRGRVARLAQSDSAGDVAAVLRLRPGVEVFDLLGAASATQRHVDRFIEHGAALEDLGSDLFDGLRR